MSEQGEQPSWKQFAIIGVVAAWLVLGVYFLYHFGILGGAREPTVAELEQSALTAATTEEKEKAAVKLASFGEAGREPLRRVLKTTQDASVRAASIDGLGGMWDYDSMDAMVAALSDESPLVRRRAHFVVQRMLQLNLAYNPADPAPQRARAVKVIDDAWKKMAAHPSFSEWKKTSAEMAKTPVESP